MRVVSIQQPQYFPWLGYFEQIRVSDENILLDSVQWTKQGRQHRTILQGRDNKRSWLSIPIQSHGHRKKTIREMEIDPGQDWKKRHWRIITEHYRHSPFFHTQLEPLLRPWFELPVTSKFLVDVLENSLRLVAEALKLNGDFLASSQLPIPGISTDRLVNLCVERGADVYYSSIGSTPYLEVAKFRPYKIRVITQHWRAPDDLGNLSVIQALAWHSLAEIQECLEPKPWSFFGVNKHL